jgi:hypothetical protein
VSINLSDIFYETMRASPSLSLVGPARGTNVGESPSPGSSM